MSRRVPFQDGPYLSTFAIASVSMKPSPRPLVVRMKPPFSIPPDVTAYIQRDGVLVRKRGGNSLFVPVIIVRERVSYIMYYILINIF